MTCTTTHHACDCVLKRMAKLEAVAEAAKHAIELGYLGEGSTANMMEDALKKLES